MDYTITPTMNDFASRIERPMRCWLMIWLAPNAKVPLVFYQPIACFNAGSKCETFIFCSISFSESAAGAVSRLPMRNVTRNPVEPHEHFEFILTGFCKHLQKYAAVSKIKSPKDMKRAERCWLTYQRLQILKHLQRQQTPDTDAPFAQIGNDSSIFRSTCSVHVSPEHQSRFKL
jgi:hypothetical protein